MLCCMDLEEKEDAWKKADNGTDINQISCKY